jgi:hypothetical protein
MSHPEDIPQDVWSVATRVWLEMRTVEHKCSDEWFEFDAEEIARAIMAAKAEEREQCAKLAELVTKAPGQRNEKHQWREQIGAEVAVAIRKREAQS